MSHSISTKQDFQTQAQARSVFNARLETLSNDAEIDVKELDGYFPNDCDPKPFQSLPLIREDVENLAERYFELCLEQHFSVNDIQSHKAHGEPMITAI